MSAATLSLDDKYTRESGRVFLNGTQALVRLAMAQRDRDLAAGLNTAGFISGYRGSPLGGLDQALWKAKKHLESHHLFFTPGVNEELAATAVWGSQQAGLFPGAKYDGVFAMWYGKGPGVDRCGDVFKHANAAGTARHGGVLLVAGDDHACKSSTLPHQSEHAFDAAMIPVLYPTGVKEILELGLHGFAMSRFSGCYVALKTVSETVDSTASIDLASAFPAITLPEGYPVPAGGMNIRWPDAPMDQELRLQKDKIYAALAYCRANRLNRITIDSPHPRLGIIASGKSYLDVLQALENLGIDERHAAEIGIRLCKVAMPWPLEPEGVREFARGLDEVLVVEEKRQLIEYQLKEQLYNGATTCARASSESTTSSGNGRRTATTGCCRPPVNSRPRWSRASLPRAHRQVPYVEGGRGAARVPGGEASRAGQAATEGRADSLFLFRLPAQHVDAGAGGIEGARRHRLPLHGDLDPARRDHDLHADGRRRRPVGRHPAVHANAPRLRQHRRRHLFPFRPSRDPLGHRRGREHDLQDPLQRRRGDDGRAARGRQPHRADAHAAGGCGRREEDRGGHGRAGEVPRNARTRRRRHGSPSRRAGLGAARAARHSGRHGPGLRPDLRGGEAPPPQARPLPRSRAARGDQRTRVRGLRRLRGEVELPVDRPGRHRIRAQACHRPEHLQQGLFLPQGFLPELRDGGGRQPSQAKDRGTEGRRICCPSRCFPPWIVRGASWSRAWAGRAWSRSAR